MIFDFLSNFMVRRPKKSARIIKVINTGSYPVIVLDAGSNSGVREGDTYEYIEYKDEDIIDPDTGENLGSITVHGAVLEYKVSKVYNRYCECKNTNRWWGGPEAPVGSLVIEK